MSEKLTKQAADRLGAPVAAAAMVVPPGATLYKSYAPSSKALTGGGPIGAALASKLGDQGSGMAATIPRQQGVIAVADDRIVYFKKKTLGVGVGERLVDWPSRELTVEFVEPLKGSYPGLSLTFEDGSTSLLLGEKKWGLDAFAAAVHR